MGGEEPPVGKVASPQAELPEPEGEVICRHRIAEKKVADSIYSIVHVYTIIPLLQKIFVHFCNCTKRSVAVFDNISVTKMLLSSKIKQIKSTTLS